MLKYKYLLRFSKLFKDIENYGFWIKEYQLTLTLLFLSSHFFLLLQKYFLPSKISWNTKFQLSKSEIHKRRHCASFVTSKCTIIPQSVHALKRALNVAYDLSNKGVSDVSWNDMT